MAEREEPTRSLRDPTGNLPETHPKPYLKQRRSAPPPLYLRTESERSLKITMILFLPYLKCHVKRCNHLVSIPTGHSEGA